MERGGELVFRERQISLDRMEWQHAPKAQLSPVDDWMEDTRDHEGLALTMYFFTIKQQRNCSLGKGMPMRISRANEFASVRCSSCALL